MESQSIVVFQDYLSEARDLINWNKENQSHIKKVVVALIHVSLKEMELYINSHHAKQAQVVQVAYKNWSGYCSTREKEVNYNESDKDLIVTVSFINDL